MGAPSFAKVRKFLSICEYMLEKPGWFFVDRTRPKRLFLSAFRSSFFQWNQSGQSHKTTNDYESPGIPTRDISKSAL
jgi:hypothetical protein